MNTPPTSIGIRQNLQQFILLVILTAFIGGMVGMERSLIPQLAEKVFHLASKTAMFSFIVAFGISKAFTNYFTGSFANKLGRKNLLVLGWLFALPIPWILMYAPVWNWIIAANILLGINQGLCWSSTVMMKIDLAEKENRGLAMGLNEFSGYLAVGLVTFLVSWIAARYGLRPYPFYTGVIFSMVGLLASIFLIKDTRAQMAIAAHTEIDRKKLSDGNYARWQKRNRFAVTQAGVVNNLNDGMMWGLYPLLLSLKGFELTEVGLITAVYPACWGIGQLFTGRFGDYLPKKQLIFAGLLLQAVTLLSLAAASSFTFFIVLSILLGLGKALVYPNFLSAIAENAHPVERAKSIGTFRFFRDTGYAIGAIVTGLTADHFNLRTAMVLVGGITLFSALIVAFRMRAR